jgi:glycosyltransferase involved in cell wall biosynthesis
VLQVPGFAERGMGRYSVGLASALATAGRLGTALLAPELPPPAGLPTALVERDLVRWDGGPAMREALDRPGATVHLVAAPFLHTGVADPGSLVVAPHWARAGVPRAVVLYDLIPLRAPRHYLSAPGAAERYRARADWVAASELILTISEHTRRDALELLGGDPDRVVTIGAGVSPFFSPADTADDELFAAHLGDWVGRPFVFCVTGSDVRKNTDRLIRAMAEVPEAGLVVAGHLTADWAERLAGEAAGAGVAGRTRFVGEVSDELLRACYRRAVLTVMPSLAEGLGLPVLESAACGTAAVASATSALGEAAGHPAARFDPTDPSAVAACINRLLGDAGLRAEVVGEQAARAAAATWSSVAARAAAAADRAVTGPPGTAPASGSAPAPRPAGPRPAPARWSVPGPPRPAVALVGPFAPAGGGLGRYHRELAMALAGQVALTTASAVPAEPVPGAEHVDTSLLGGPVRPASFDATVYTLGNSAGHLETVRAALRHPGWLWLHESRLPGIALTALEGLDDECFTAAVGELVERAYPGRAPLHAARRAGRDNLALIEGGVGLLPLLASRCRGILVNSRAAARSVLIDLPPGVHAPPVHVLPPAVAGTHPVEHRPSGGGPLVVSFGVVSWAKRPDVVIRACRALGSRVAFVGACPPVVAEAIGNIAAHLSVADRVTVTGEVDGPTWEGWLREADVALQLREPSTGEMSAAVLDAMASGLPVVTNLTSAGEYPEGTCRYVPDVSPEAVAEAVGELLSAPGERRAVAEAALAFTGAHRFDGLAAAVLSIVLPDH